MKKFKARLARIRVGSFRYQMTEGIWGKKRINKYTKACSFYWWYIPSSAIAWAAIGIAFVLWSAITYLIIVPIAFLVGFFPEKSVANTSDPDAWAWHGKYGYNPITKKYNKVAPQHWLLLGLAVLALILFGSQFPWDTIFRFTLGLAIGFAIVTLIGYIVTRKATKEYWHRICPKLEIVKEDGIQ